MLDLFGAVWFLRAEDLDAFMHLPQPLVPRTGVVRGAGAVSALGAVDAVECGGDFEQAGASSR